MRTLAACALCKIGLLLLSLALLVCADFTAVEHATDTALPAYITKLDKVGGYADRLTSATTAVIFHPRAKYLA